MSEDKPKKDKKDKEGEEEARRYSGTKDPADRLFAEWICRQWARGEHLEKIDVIEYFSKGPRKGFGDPVDHEVFTTAHRVDMEEATDLSNRLHGSAQINCDRIHKREMTYYARAFDRGRASTAETVDTFPLTIFPRPVHGRSVVDLESEEVTEKTLAIDYLRAGMSAYQRDLDRQDANAGDLIYALMQERASERAWTMRLAEMFRSTLTDWAQAVREREAAMSQEADRAPVRELAKIKAEILRDGFRAGKNMLTSAFSRLFIKSGDGTPGGTNGERELNAPAAPMSQEQILLEEFFQDCKNAKIDNALFGTWEKGPDGRAKCVQAGVFSEEQFALLLKVHKGSIGAEALDDLLMDSGSPHAVTMDQLSRAQMVEGMTEGIGASLVALMKIRLEAREQKASATATTTTSPPPKTPTPNERPNTEGYDDV